MAAYYNECDKFAANWLRMLIVNGSIAPGDVDTRSIEDVTARDIIGYTQCHFFAGIGGWSSALRLAGWPDSRPVWTASCPCQPFSAAGKGGGVADERHLWPAAHWLIAQRRPVTIFGEQVASPAGLSWFDTVSADLEDTAYSCRAVDICAAGIGAPHIRQRLYFRADSQFRGLEQLSDTSRKSSEVFRTSIESSECLQSISRYMPSSSECADSSSGIASDGELQRSGQHGWLGETETRSATASGATRGFWGDADWWHGRDEKYRPIEPGLFPLAHGVSGRMGKLRGYGNAIVAPLAAEFIKATEEVNYDC